jgi:TRAP-type transport system periplasmic protein
MNKLLCGLCVGAALAAFPAWSQSLQLAHNAAPGNPKAEASNGSPNSSSRRRTAE